MARLRKNGGNSIMNANKLADALEVYRDIGDWRDPQRIAAAIMLRQQQAELAISENLIKHLHSENKELRLEIEQQQVKIKVLKETIQGRDKCIDLIMESYEKGIKK